MHESVGNAVCYGLSRMPLSSRQVQTQLTDIGIKSTLRATSVVRSIQSANAENRDGCNTQDNHGRSVCLQAGHHSRPIYMLYKKTTNASHM
ncbi:hypothetical protein K439DRAFT_1126342 [Ramaria rubella]|nr:hypothetical protein K439DRAFT_1126342 [Ramaria rubella]